MIIDGYVRVSQVGDRKGESFISPDAQRQQIERWATLHRAVVGYVFEELDESGGRKDRPLLEAAIARVEAGESQGLVVAYLSRLGRSVLHGLRAIERITDAGGTFVSVEEGVDFSTDTGRLMLRMWLSWAEWELDRTRSSWNLAKKRAIARGVQPGATPFGYVRRADGRFAIDPIRGTIVTELFRRRAAGAEIRDLERFLAGLRIKTPRGSEAWHPSSVRHLLSRRVYRGEVHYGPLSNLSAHRALVDESTWQCAQLSAQDQRPRRDPEPALLAGILRCAGCQRVLGVAVRDSGTSTEDHLYRCSKRSRGCPAPVSVVNAHVDPYIEALFWQQLEQGDKRWVGTRLNRLGRERQRRERELEAYRDNAALPVTLGPERFARGLAVRTARAERVAVEHARAELKERIVLPSAGELRESWSSMSVDERRAAIKAVIECIFVLPGTTRSVEERVFVCLRGRAPEGLPRDIRFWPEPTKPFDARRCKPSARLTTPETDWTQARLCRALVPFVVGRQRWPNFPEFQAAGLTSLYRQVERHGGQRRWADLLGMSYLPGRTAGGGWTEDRVRAALRDYLDGRTTWPSWQEFCADGQSQVRLALRWYGGPQRWAHELGVELDSRQDIRRERWSYARMKQELADLCRERDDWPPASEFKAAGLERLHYAICRTRAQPRLAAELGMRLPTRRRPSRWTDDAIKDAMETLLQGRTIWPTHREFAEAGLGGLPAVLRRKGGREIWARRYGLKPPRIPRRE